MELRELKSKSQLDEGFAIVVGSIKDKELLFVEGFRINEKYAIIYNYKTGTYAVTHIDSGMRVSNTYTSFKEAKTMYKVAVKDAERKIEREKLGEFVKKAERELQSLLKEYHIKHASTKTRNGRRSKKKTHRKTTKGCQKYVWTSL